MKVDSLNLSTRLTSDLDDFQMEEGNFENEEKKIKETSLFSKLFFLWTLPLFKLSKTKTLTFDTLINGFKKPFNTSISEFDILNPQKRLFDYYNNNKRKTYKKLFLSIIMANIKEIIIVFLVSLSFTILRIIQIYLLKTVIMLFQNINKENFSSELIKYSILLLTVKLGQIILNHQNDYLCQILCNNASNSLKNLIYEKILKSSIFIKENFNKGQLINFIQNDSETLSFLFDYAPMTLVVPIQLIINLYMLFKLFGFSFIYSLITFFILISCAWYIEEFYSKNQKELLSIKDDRIKVTNSILEMIKIIKMLTYENIAFEKIEEKRNKELTLMRKIQNIFVLNNFIHWVIPFALSLVSIGVHTYIYGHMKIENIIVAIEIYDSVAYPLYRLPIFITNLISCVVSLKRIEEFLNVNEIMKFNLLKNNFRNDFYLNSENNDFLFQDYAIFLQNVNFGIVNDNRNLVLLKDINLKIKKGELVGIIGETGSGKTCLINSLLNYFDIIPKNNNDKKDNDINYNNNNNITNNIDNNNNNKLNDKKKKMKNLKNLNNNNINNKKNKNYIKKINGKISYASQTPFIVNDTIKNNIIFYNNEELQKYESIIDICQLEQDISNLSGNDYTEISSNGTNISGGQKARISFARAVYQDADIYLFDDPISSVDSIISNKIFEKVILNYLDKKTRIFCRNSLFGLNYMDRIIVLEKGTIIFDGNYNTFCSSEIYEKMIKKEKIENENKKFEKKKFVKKKDYKQISKIIKFQNDSDSTSKNSINLKRGKLIIDEKQNNNKIKLSLFISFFRKMGKNSLLSSFIILILTFIWQIFQVINNYWLTKWSEAKIKDEQMKKITKNSNLYYFIIYCLIGFISLFFLFLREFQISRSNLTVNRILHNEMIMKILKAPINLFHDIVPLGQIINILNFDLDKCRNIVKFYGFISRGIATLLSSLIICYFYNKYSILFIPILFIFDFYIFKFYLPCGRNIKRIECYANTPILSWYSETVNNIISIRAFNKEEDFKNLFYNKIYNHYLINLYKTGLQNWYSLSLELSAFIYLVFIVIFSIIFHKNFSPSAIGLLLKYSINFCDQLLFVFEYFGNIENEMIHYERCNNYTKLVQEKYIPGLNNPFLKNKFKIKNPIIKFENYTSRYRPNTEIILNNINIIINPKEKIGIVGRSGSGKSSLINAIYRIIEPLSGKIYIDNIDICKIPLIQLRNEICIVPQEPNLLNGDLKYNLDPKNLYCENDIINSLKKVNFNFNKFFSLGEKILNKNISDNLSLGEKQLICFSRAILTKKKIVIFDEATANLDKDSEEIINKVIKDEFKDCTIFIVAHKLINIKDCDKILVMDKGKIAEFDSPKKLYNDNKSIFRQLCIHDNLVL